ncbi:extracellular solute-binding protein [Rhodobacteraceae bacterium N5(2021)]|uniref:Extracellular solute-binding protein n=1 Tax=Gymnodinialimonas phycosphaerae TaxID=2841589 RepID=A0A975YF06_9RHOB|nr:extracellular solute-binding protein [Gymnodinialimonas phycosphaerae]MBY4894193.1 extracellular solute-binding protein [Gymnodinialimonas phycosphaerae]
MTRTISLLLGTTVALSAATAAQAQELNLYSSRHYETDERLYSDFTDLTGITINRIEGNADELIARMGAEGANSPADVFLTVDTSRLQRAADMGVLQPLENALLEERIPANLRDDDGMWFGFSQRARIIFYDTERVANPPQTYLELADPAYEGMICIRSSTNTYNQTLLAAMIENHGEEAAREWAAGIVANMARDPQGGDTDQLRGLVSGECDISVSNTYYMARAIRRDVEALSAEDRATIGWVFPDQGGNGAHVNLSGGGIAAHAPNMEAAVAFMEYLASEQAQEYFSAGNDEYPVVEGVAIAPSAMELGEFEADDVSLAAVAANLPLAQQIFNDVGWE